ERFQAFGRLLECYPDNQGKVVFMQIAAPSRTDVPEYKEIRRSLATVVGQINGRFAEYDWTPIRHINKGFSRASVMGFLSIGRVGVVTPLRDGMNLVAKEFIAAQDPDDPGVLLLSQLAGAAQELDSAVFVNPYDIDGIAEGMQYAISMPLKERTERWQHMMTILRKNDINAWRDSFLRRLLETHRKLKRVS
ncbi:MAG: trehalose-6-phosphate synthase, partial [Gammaproteobacteria bacterium]